MKKFLTVMAGLAAIVAVLMFALSIHFSVMTASGQFISYGFMALIVVMALGLARDIS